MCYQVSDTNVRNPRIRSTVLWHALLPYLFGVVIVGGSVNLIAGLIANPAAGTLASAGDPGQWQLAWPESAKCLPGSGRNRQV
jgi:hypothetical protein